MPATSSDISPLDQELLEAASAVRERAYAPYSMFPVGAALRDETGAIHVGVNVENAAYPVGTCAEAGAIAAMVAQGGRRIVGLLVLGDGRALVTPCGACRQRIREFAHSATPIHMVRPDGTGLTSTLSDLLPLSFGPETLREHE